MNEESKKKHFCPYCDQEILTAEFLYCQPCGVKLRYCLSCNIVVEMKAKGCPQCGQPLEEED